MYYVSKSCIKNSSTTRSQFFASKLGIKELDNLSPNLLTKFVNDLPAYPRQTIDPIVLNSRPVHCLMYADDIVLLSSSSVGLNMLEKFCQE